MYGLDLTVDNLNSNGLILTDKSSRTVGVCEGELRGTLIHTTAPYADISVLVVKGLLMGWIDSGQMQDAGDRWLIAAQSLHPMPDSFNFAQPCPHMSKYGGYLDPEHQNWRCFGCGKILPFIG